MKMMRQKQYMFLLEKSRWGMVSPKERLNLIAEGMMSALGVLLADSGHTHTESL